MPQSIHLFICLPVCLAPLPRAAHGTSLTVSPSYQLSYASLPFRAAGYMGGLTLRRQFEKAFAMSEPSAATPLDLLLVGAFNEHIAQPQPNPFSSDAAAISMGFEGDAFNRNLWVDTFGAWQGGDAACGFSDEVMSPSTCIREVVRRLAAAA